MKDRNYFRKNIQYINKKVSLFHCTTEYPAPLNELNLNVIDTFNENIIWILVIQIILVYL